MTQAVKEWDVITLSGLRAVGNHGVYDFERASTQDFIADLTLYVDTRSAASSDDLADTVDYSQVAEDAVAVMTGPAVFLIETLASRLAELALTYPRVVKAQVTVHKPMAPLRHQFSDVAVTVIRERRKGNLSPAAQAKPQSGEQPVVRDVAQQPVVREAGPQPVKAVPTRVTETSPRPSAGGKHGREGINPTYRRTPTRPHPHTYDVVLALGGNRGSVVANLRGSVAALADLDGFEIVAVSPLIRTEPVLEEGALPQDDYFNAVVIAKTVLAPPALLAATQGIETQFGRVRAGRWGARTLDIDIIDLDRMTLNLKTLTLPHPRAHGRAFVLYPWTRADADAHLVGHGFVRDLLTRADDLGGIIAEYPGWLERDGNDPGEEVSLHLAPRSSRHRTLHKDAYSPHVVLRGEEVVLADVEDDPIFQKLLVKEQRDAKLVPRTHAKEMPVAQVSPPPRPGLRKSLAARHGRSEQRVGTVEVPTTEVVDVGIPVRPALDRAPSGAREVPQQALPDWEFSTRQQPVRVVDSIDQIDEGEETPVEGVRVQHERAINHSNAAAARPSVAGGTIPRVARGVTVRPTPTGSLPLARRQSQGSGNQKRSSEIQTEKR